MKLATIAALAKALGGGSGGGGSGGDNGFFDITITDWDAQTIDKTYAEIVAAIAAGKTIRVIDEYGARLSGTAEGTASGGVGYVWVYPIWIDFDLSRDDSAQIAINTMRINVLENGSVVFERYASFEISGTYDDDT